MSLTTVVFLQVNVQDCAYPTANNMHVISECVLPHLRSLSDVCDIMKPTHLKTGSIRCHYMYALLASNNILSIQPMKDMCNALGVIDTSGCNVFPH